MINGSQWDDDKYICSDLQSVPIRQVLNDLQLQAYGETLRAHP